MQNNTTNLPDPNAFIREKSQQILACNRIDPADLRRSDVRPGLRNPDGTGVVAGVTHLCNVRGYVVVDGERVPIPGQLTFRGINVEDIVTGVTAEKRFGYEEVSYLLLFGKLPTAAELQTFKSIMAELRPLPIRFTEDMILTAPSRDIMNKLERNILSMYSYDPDPEPTTIEKELGQALQIIARVPVAIAHAFAAKRHYFDGASLYLHRPQEDLSLAENFLYSIRPDNVFTREEALILDLCMMLHAEHGGGNNSAFACRVLSSSGTDIYSSLAAAVGSLKGPRHGGANLKAGEMLREIRENVADWTSDGQITDYLRKIVRKEAGDGSGLIYGMGHAIYTLSDPRAEILRRVARPLAADKGRTEELDLIERVVRLSPAVLAGEKDRQKAICANVDMFSGFVYSCLGIPEELFTPLFAMSRISGWCAHRIEEVYNHNKLIRPAYKVIFKETPYTPLAER